jgi:flagellar protein FlaF
MRQGARQTGYVSQPAAKDPRSTEAWALSEASRRLVVASKTQDGGKSLREALVLNQRLWTIFQTSLTEKDCPLPMEIRQNVLTLSIMLDRQILLRLGDLDGSKLQPILDINRCVAEGLAQRPQSQAEAAVHNLAQAPLAQGLQQPMPPMAGAGVAAAPKRVAINVSA